MTRTGREIPCTMSDMPSESNSAEHNPQEPPAEDIPVPTNNEHSAGPPDCDGTVSSAPEGELQAPVESKDTENSSGHNANTKAQDSRRPAIDDGANKIFVGGITQETTEEDLRGYFTQHGNIVDITIMKDRMTGKSRGFAFITFDTPEAAEKLVSSKHEINGKMVEAKPAVPRGSQSNMGGRPNPGFNMPESPRATKIFVGGLSPTVEDAQLKDYFSQFGTVIEASVAVEKETSRKRGFGFVTFGSYQTVDEVLAKKEHSIADKVVEVKKALPKGSGMQAPFGRGAPMSMSARPAPYQAGRGYSAGQQGYYGGHEGYGQQAGGYSYYGGYDQSSSRYPGYSQSGGGYGQGGYYGAQGSGYGDQHGAQGGYGHADASSHAGQMYASSGMSGYDGKQQGAYNSQYGGAYAGTAATTGYSAASTGYGASASTTGYGASAASTGYGASAGYAGSTAAAATTYGGYGDASSAYNGYGKDRAAGGYEDNAAARYHPYMR